MNTKSLNYETFYHVYMVKMYDNYIRILYINEGTVNKSIIILLWIDKKNLFSYLKIHNSHFKYVYFSEYLKKYIKVNVQNRNTLGYTINLKLNTLLLRSWCFIDLSFF